MLKRRNGTKKWAVCLLAMAWMICFATGCQSNYEPYETAQTSKAEEPEKKETKAVTVSISGKETHLSEEAAITMAERNETVYVTGDQVNVRSSASLSGPVLTMLNKGAELKRTGYHDANMYL